KNHNHAYAAVASIKHETTQSSRLNMQEIVENGRATSATAVRWRHGESVKKKKMRNH
ncbi:unnamed protein product, partial [Ceratitis capitata]